MEGHLGHLVSNKIRVCHSLPRIEVLGILDQYLYETGRLERA